MSTHRIVVIGASAGGVEALSRVVGGLPADFSGTVLVVLHIAADAPSVLPDILGRASHLRSVAATDDAPIERGTIYVAPPDYHMIVRGDRLRLLRGPRENGHRPGIDPLFRSAARRFGAGVVGVVLTGNLGDGTLGLAEVKAHGGTAIVQSPNEAPFPSMPRSAIAHVDVDHVVPVAQIAPLLARLCAAAPGGARPPTDATSLDDVELDDVELDGSRRTDDSIHENEALGGQVSPFTCPECHGTLWEIDGGAQRRYRCRVGHSFSEPSLAQEKELTLETALWTALTTLEESASLARRMEADAARRDRSYMADWFRRRAGMLEQRGKIIRDLIDRLPDGPIADEPGGVPSAASLGTPNEVG